MERLKEFLQWHLQNPHNVNFKMIVGYEDRLETLEAMKEIISLLDTGFTPEQVQKLKERNTAKKQELINGGVPVCPVCGAKVFAHYWFCKECGLRLEWKD